MSSLTESSYNLTGIGVSKKLFDVKSDILKTGTQLEAILPTKVSLFARDTLNKLEAHVCRIAFVGQIKAGKSSLINALISKPGLLPTDINPSTAVVTKIFFGGPSQSQNTALFHFFSESEWEGMMSGKLGPQGVAKHQSLPSARQKLTELQNRAEKRLGSDYSRLLGKHHLFSSITPQILDQYVSAGDYNTSPDNKLLYSDLTKMAEIFLEGMPFTYPSVMIDTPGVNDLFFVRDEITHSNLADADIYILVLSAQNPLSEGDISLLRLLKGLQRDKIIAVVNRIDRLENPGREMADIEAYVKQVLRREFPNTSIPVLMASALWGNMALTELHTPRNGTDRTNITVPVKPSEDTYGSPVSSSHAKANILLARSGIPKIVEFISQFMTNAVAEEQLLPSATTLSAMAHNTVMSSGLSLRSLTPDKIISNNHIDISSELRRQVTTNLDQLTALINEVESVLTETLHDWDDEATKEIANLERYIFHSIDSFAEYQAKAFITESKRDFSNNFFRNALRFRSELSDDFAGYHTQISKSLLSKQNEAETLLRRIVRTRLPGLNNFLQFGFTSRRIKPPSIMSLARATALETDEYWELIKKKPEPEHANQLADIKIIINSEFISILKDMLESAKEDLNVTGDEIINRLRLMVFSAIFPLVGHLIYLSEVIRQKSDQANAVKIEINANFMKSFQNRIKKSLLEEETLLSQLNIIKKQCLLVPMG